MKTQFGNDPMRVNDERVLKIVTWILIVFAWGWEIFSILGGTKTWLEAIKSDWVLIILSLGTLNYRVGLIVALISLPILVWVQLDAGALTLKMFRHAPWNVWLLSVLWLFYAFIFFSMLFKGKLLPKNDKALT